MTNTRLLARDEVPTELTWDLTLLLSLIHI